MSKRHFLEFEQPIAELETKIEELRYVQSESAVDISDEIDQLGKKSQQLTKDIYSQLSPWQITKIARHPERPYTMDYVNEIFTSHLVGLDDDESDALLRQLVKQARIPEYQCRFRWTAGSVAFWDNRSTQHYAASDYWPQRRVMDRISIAGDRPVGIA